MRKTKILITGASGFVGKNLIMEIKNNQKFDLIALSRKELNLGGVEVAKVDLKNNSSITKAVKSIDMVVHLAFSKNYSENLKMTNNLIAACRKAKVKKIIGLSSMSAKRKNPDDYGKAKIQTEKMIKSSGMNYTILRPSIIYGKGSTSFNFMIDYIKKIPFVTPIIGDGKYTIMPVHTSDVVTSIEKCIINKATDKKEYDLAGGEKIYFLELVNYLKKDLNVKKRNLHIPIWICKVVALLIPKIISQKNIRNLVEDTQADINPAKNDFGYNPTRFHDGVKNGLI